MSSHDRGPGADDRGERPTAEYVAVAAVVAVVLLVVSGVAAMELFLNPGGTMETNVQAGASVVSNESAGNVTVTWTSNQNADVLLVGFERGDEAMRVAAATGDANTTGDRVVLTAVGESVTFAERQPTATPPAEERATPRTVEVIVIADDDGSQTVIIAKEVEV